MKKNVAIYLITAILNKMIPFLLLPILTKYLSPAEYGVIAIYTTLITFATPLIGINLQGNISRNFYKESKEKVAKIISNIFIILFGSFILFEIFTGVYIHIFKTMFDIPPYWLLMIPVIVLFQMIREFNLTIIRNNRQAIIYGIYQIVATLVEILMVFYLIICLHKGWEGRANAILIASLIFGIIGFTHTYKTGYFKPNFNKDTIKTLLKVSIPLIFYSIGGIIINMSDRFFIDRMLGKEMLGIYAVGYSFGMMISILTNAFNKDWSAWIYREFAHITEERKREIVKITYLYSLSLIVLAILSNFASYILIHFMTNERYHSGKEFIIWVSLSYAVNGMNQLFFPYFNQVGKTKRIAVISFISAIINIIFTYILIKANGAVGAAQATLISFIFLLLVSWWSAQKIYPMPWNLLDKSFIKKDLQVTENPEKIN